MGRSFVLITSGNERVNGGSFDSPLSKGSDTS